jgi:hypothetical protein
MTKNTKKPKNGAAKNGAAKTQIHAATATSATVTAAPVAAKPVMATPTATIAKPRAAAPTFSAAPKPPPPNVGHVSLELLQPGAKTVCVAGSFNEWKPEKAPLVQMGNGRWVGDLTVNPGKYEYLFVVDGQWLPDPNAKESVQNPFGGRNSVLTVSV